LTLRSSRKPNSHAAQQDFVKLRHYHSVTTWRHRREIEEELFDLVFPKEWDVTGHLCMIYHCYLDDSKDQNQSQMVVSAGFVGTQNDWGKLRISWTKRLNEDGLKYFKTSEFKMLTEQFARFKTADYPPPTGREKARQIRSDLQAILKRVSGIRGIGLCLPMDDLNKVCARPEATPYYAGDPYNLAFQSVLHETVGFIRRKPGRNMVAFVHDDGPNYDMLRHFYMGFKEQNPRTAKYMAGFQPLSDKDHPPLQAADMVANLALGIGIEWLENCRKVETLKELRESIDKVGVWTQDYLLSVLKANLVGHNKPIPLDLQSEEY
jgi:hypothetical protein